MISSPKLQSLSSLFFHSTLSFRCQEAFIGLLPHLTPILLPHSLTLSYHSIALLSFRPLIPQALIPLAPSFNPSLSYHHFTSCTLLSHPSHSTPFTQHHRATPITSSTALLSYPSLLYLLTRSFHHTLSPHHLTSLAHPSHSTHPPSLPPLSFHPTFPPLHSLPHPFHPAPYTLLYLPLRRPHSLIYLTPLYCPTLLQLISAPSHSHNFSTFMYYYIRFIPPTLLPNPFAGLSPSHLTFSTYSPNQLR